MKAALFDLDETLLDRTLSLKYFAAWQSAHILDAKGSADIKFIERFVELDANGTVWKDVVYEKLIAEFNIKNHSVEQLLETYLLRFCEFCVPRQGAKKAVEYFHNQGCKLGLVTNGVSGFQERNFEALGFAHLFGTVVVSEAVKSRKPEKQIFEIACKALKANIHESVFIGDNPVVDIQGAKQAGMATIYVPAFKGHEQCEFADVTYTELAGVTSYVCSRK